MPTEKDVSDFLKTSSVKISNTTGLDTIYIQNVLGNGECFFRAFINGLRFIYNKDNFGYWVGNGGHIDTLIIQQLKECILTYMKYYLGDNGKTEIQKCVENNTNNTNNCKNLIIWLGLLYYEMNIVGITNYDEFAKEFMKPTYYGGLMEAHILSFIFNVRINLFTRLINTNEETFNLSHEIISDGDIIGNINLFGTGNHWMFIYPKLP